MAHREKVTPPPSPSPLNRMKSPFIPNSAHAVSRPSSQPPQSRLSLRTRTKFRLLILTILTLAFIFILNEIKCSRHGCMGVRHIGEGGKVEMIGGGSVLPAGWRGGSGDDAKENVEVQKIVDGGAEGAKTGAGVDAGVGHGDDLDVEGSGRKYKSWKSSSETVPSPEEEDNISHGEWMGGQAKAAFDDGPASTSSPSPSSTPLTLSENKVDAAVPAKESGTSSVAVGKPTTSPSSKKNTTSHVNTKPNFSAPKQKVQPNLRPVTHPHSLSKSPLDHAVYTGLQDNGPEDDDMAENEDGYEGEDEDEEEDEYETPSSKPIKPLKQSITDTSRASSPLSKSRPASDPESEKGIETEGERKSKALALSVTSLVPAPANAGADAAMQLGSMDMGVLGGM